ncbi:methyltransferase domain-containing protein [Methylobacterium sp. NPDC080182]|uniref:methyltransferase domain-containing protein n=1 Tax=Methylobacterium sp. NPDC080182 TaxID=3390590 RepID=UPI003D07740D
MDDQDKQFITQQILDVGRQLYAALDSKIMTAHAQQLAQMQDVRRLAVVQLAPKNDFCLVTDHPIAYESNDHTVPRGTKDDNTRNQRFCHAIESHFGRKVRALDLGCAGGGLVFDFLIRGNAAFGIEGSDYSLRAQRAEWSIIPDYLKTCDITKPFSLMDQRSGTKAKFDVITMWEVLEHIEEPLLPQLFANVKSHLADGGLFVGSAATYDDVANGVSYHPTVKPETWWRELVRQHGLEFVPMTMFQFKDFCRGSGNENAFYDADFSKNPELGFHFVMKHRSA